MKEASCKALPKEMVKADTQAAEMARLHQFEALEKKWGVDLIKLLTAEYIWVKDFHGRIYSYSVVNKITSADTITYAVEYGEEEDADVYKDIPLDEYGKTWAFTDKELMK